MMDPAERQELLVRMFGTVSAYDESNGLFYISPDRIGFGFIAPLVAGYDKSFEDALNGQMNLAYPNGTISQYVMYASPDIEETLHDYRVMRHGQDDPLLKEVTEQRIKFLRELTFRPIGETSGARLRQTRLVMTIQVKVGVDAPTPEMIREILEQTDKQSVLEHLKDEIKRKIQHNFYGSPKG